MPSVEPTALRASVVTHTRTGAPDGRAARGSPPRAACRRRVAPVVALSADPRGARRSRRRRCAPRSPSCAARGRSRAPRPSRARPRARREGERGEAGGARREAARRREVVARSNLGVALLARGAPHAIEQLGRARLASRRRRARRSGRRGPRWSVGRSGRACASRARRASPRGSARPGSSRRLRACPSTSRARCSDGRWRRPRSWRRLALERSGPALRRTPTWRSPRTPRAFHASSTASATACDGTSATTHPPPPAPVSFAPSAPARARGRTSLDLRASRRRDPEEHLVQIHQPPERDAIARLEREPRARARARGCPRTFDRPLPARARAGARRPRPSTLVLDALPVLPTQSCSGPRTRTGSMASPRRKSTHPPRAATAASTPLGLPWKTRSQAIACAWMASASGAAEQSARAIATPIAAEHPRPPPGGSAASTSTSCGSSDGQRARAAFEQRAEGAREVVVEPVLVHGDVPAAHEEPARPALRGDALARARRDRSRPRAPARRRRRRARRAGSPSRRRVRRRLISSVSRSGRRSSARAGRGPAGASAGAPEGRARRRAQLGDARLDAPARTARLDPGDGLANVRRRSRRGARARGSSASAARASRRASTTSAVRLPSRRSLLAGLPVVVGVAEGAEHIVAKLKGDAERLGERRRAPRPVLARPASRAPMSDRPADRVARRLERVHGLDRARVAGGAPHVEDLARDHVLVDPRELERRARRRARGQLQLEERRCAQAPARSPARMLIASRARGTEVLAHHARARSDRPVAPRRRPSSRRG